MLLSIKKKKKVLIVDDDAAIRQMFSVYMKSWGLDPVLADSGLKAVEMAQKDPPDLILLDLTMPPPDGFEVCSMLKSDKKTKNIPIIVLSGSSKNSSIDSMYNLGITNYMIKPVQWDRLKIKLKELKIV